MPAYDFLCQRCGKVEEHYRTMDERDNAPSHCSMPMLRQLATPMVSVDYPAYRSVAADKETGKQVWIEGKKQHKEFVKRNGYEETA